jgi:eukaryotic-like serine/threonine-protein kinase
LALDVWCSKHRPSVPERLRLFLQIVQAVAYAHGRLVVHRDLKPSNVLVAADGRARLLDFGIAKLLSDTASAYLTQEQGRVLTPHYASPEQIEGKPITVASDIYSLGALLYELLTAQRPHVRGGAMQEATLSSDPPLASSRVDDPATRKALRGELDAILAMALRRDPKERYATAEALAADVERYLSGERVLAQPDSLAYRVRKFLRRHWLGATASAAVLLAIVAGFASTLTLYFKVLHARADAELQAAVARDVNDYLVRDLLAAANPMSADVPATGASAPLPGQVPARTLLDRAANSAGKRFAGQPALEALVRMSLGEAYSGNAAHAESAQQFMLAYRRFADMQPQQALSAARALLRAGASLREADDFDAAQQRLDQALATVLAQVGTQSAEVERLRVQVRQAQAWLLNKRGRYGEALEIMQSELPALVQSFGSADDEVATALLQLADTQIRAGRLREAIVTARKAMDVRLQVSGSGHPRLIEVHSKLAEALTAAGQHADAETEARAGYTMSRQLLGPDHLVTLNAEGGLASVLHDMKRFDEAIALYQDALTRCSNRYGEHSYDSSVFANNLAVVYADAGRSIEAIAAFERTLKIGVQLLGKDHPEVLIKEHNLAKVLADSGRWNEALQLERRVLPRAQKAWGPSGVNLGAVLRLLGRLLIHDRRWDEAKDSLLEARRQLGAELGGAHPGVLQIDEMLKELDHKRLQPVAPSAPG